MKFKKSYGIGVLLLTIVMMLIALSTANIYLNLTSDNTKKLQETKKNQKEIIDTNINLKNIIAYGNLTEKIPKNSNFSLIISLNQGSYDVYLKDILIDLNSNNLSKTYTYSNNSFNYNNFNVKFLKGLEKDYISEFDTIQITILNEYEILEKEKIEFNIYTKRFNLKKIDLNTKELYGDKIVLYP